MLVDAIGGIAGAAAFAIWIAALVVARLGQLGKLIGKTTTTFFYARLGQTKARTAEFARRCRLD